MTAFEKGDIVIWSGNDPKVSQTHKTFEMEDVYEMVKAAKELIPMTVYSADHARVQTKVNGNYYNWFADDLVNLTPQQVPDPEACLREQLLNAMVDRGYILDGKADDAKAGLLRFMEAVRVASIQARVTAMDDGQVAEWVKRHG